MDEAVNRTDVKSRIFRIVGVEIVCREVTGGISIFSKHTLVCAPSNTHLRPLC